MCEVKLDFIIENEEEKVEYNKKKNVGEKSGRDKRKGKGARVNGASKLHSLSRSDLGKLGCHYRTVMIYTYPSR